MIARAFRSGRSPARQIHHGSCARDDDAHAREQEQISGRDFDHHDRFERSRCARACREVGAVPRGVLGRERGSPVTVRFLYAESFRVPLVGWLVGSGVTLTAEAAARQEFG